MFSTCIDFHELNMTMSFSHGYYPFKQNISKAYIESKLGKIDK